MLIDITLIFLCIFSHSWLQKRQSAENYKKHIITLFIDVQKCQGITEIMPYFTGLSLLFDRRYQELLLDSSRMTPCRHINSIHKEQKFRCPVCDYEATLKDNLTTHIKSIHKGRKFQCQMCSFKTARKLNLCSHIQSKHALALGNIIFMLCMPEG